MEQVYYICTLHSKQSIRYICCAKFRILAESKSAARFRLKPSRPPDLDWNLNQLPDLEWINFEFTDVENESTRVDKQFRSAENKFPNVGNSYGMYVNLIDHEFN